MVKRFLKCSNAETAEKRHSSNNCLHSKLHTEPSSVLIQVGLGDVDLCPLPGTRGRFCCPLRDKGAGQGDGSVVPSL